MESDKAFFIKWYGPFSSKEEEAEWEKSQEFPFQLYLLHGMKKYAKKSESYYCGKTIRTAYKRFKDANHHISDIENRNHSIYVGRLSSCEVITDSDVRLVEKLITSYLAWELGTECLLNQTNFNTPYYINNLCVVNRWHRPDGHEYLRTPTNSPMHIVPDVMVYRFDKNTNECKLVVSPRLKPINW